MVSIVIAAHNEEAVLAATLKVLLSGNPGVHVIVVPNGCTDATAEVARGFPEVEVVELAQGGKPLALNAGDAAATSYPRIYLDADIRVPPGGVAALVKALARPDVLAAVPGRRVDTAGRPWPVRAYSEVHSRLPALREGLFGRGMIALSEEGRARFDQFPNLVADDVFVDSLYSGQEKAHVDDVQVVVAAPFTTRDLIRRLVRVRRGLAALRRAARSGEVPVPVNPSRRWSWLSDVVAREPRLLAAGIVYAGINIVAGLGARRGSVTAMDWGRDESTR